MSQNEKSSKELASLAAEVMNDPKATEREKSLAASVLTQAADHASAKDTNAVSGGDGKHPVFPGKPSAKVGGPGKTPR